MVKFQSTEPFTGKYLETFLLSSLGIMDDSRKETIAKRLNVVIEVKEQQKLEEKIKNSIRISNQIKNVLGPSKSS